MNHKKRFGTLALAIGALVMGTSANAGVITSGSVYNNTGGEYSSAFNVGLLSNQSGLSSSYVNGVTDFAAFTNSGVTHQTNEGGVTWFSKSGVPNFPLMLDFDLGASQNILSLALWNGTAGNTAAIKSFSVYTSGLADFSTLTHVGSFNNSMGVDGPEPVNVFDLANTNGRYLRMQVNSHYGNTWGTGIGEVAFDVAAVPVPAAAWLMGSGLLGLVGVARRKAA
jgi:hypothetical protein